ncbi:MAG: cysteine desulfurase [Chloroflexi bacterium]|nr:cysteine desulfurase [Chloroflexota bacterium]
MNIEALKRDFPILAREVHEGIPLVYLDSAATSQKPAGVLDAMDTYYRRYNANIHRGVHKLAEEATGAYESARERISRFVNANQAREIIFTRNATEAINLVAYSWGRKNLTKGDLVILTEMEHHSNLVPWYILAEERGIELAYVPVTPEGLLDLDTYRMLLERKPKLAAFTHMSNVLGTINPVREMIAAAHAAGALALIDGAQAVPHLPVDIQELDADFYAFSSHKMCGPTGLGILYGKERLLEAMPPFMGGGDMIKRVELGRFTVNDLPHKFEAGTPAIAEVIGLGAAVEYLAEIGMEAIHAHERQLIQYALERLEEVPGVWVFGPEASQKGGVAAFTFDGVHPHDVAEILDGNGIAVRAGHHCAMPLHQKFNITATARASFYLYNDHRDVDVLIEGLYKVRKVFGKNDKPQGQAHG